MMIVFLVNLCLIVNAVLAFNQIVGSSELLARSEVARFKRVKRSPIPQSGSSTINCPKGSVQRFQSCNCVNNKIDITLTIFDSVANLCVAPSVCPPTSKGSYPNCSCSENPSPQYQTYVPSSTGGSCGPNPCPSNASGSAGQCSCKANEKLNVYDYMINACVAPICPGFDDSTYPDCSCLKNPFIGYRTYSAALNQCVPTGSLEILIPISPKSPSSPSLYIDIFPSPTPVKSTPVSSSSPTKPIATDLPTLFNEETDFFSRFFAGQSLTPFASPPKSSSTPSPIDSPKVSSPAQELQEFPLPPSILDDSNRQSFNPFDGSASSSSSNSDSMNSGIDASPKVSSPSQDSPQPPSILGDSNRQSFNPFDGSASSASSNSDSMNSGIDASPKVNLPFQSDSPPLDSIGTDSNRKPDPANDATTSSMQDSTSSIDFTKIDSNLPTPPTMNMDPAIMYSVDSTNQSQSPGSIFDFSTPTNRDVPPPSTLPDDATRTEDSIMISSPAPSATDNSSTSTSTLDSTILQDMINTADSASAPDGKEVKQDPATQTGSSISGDSNTSVDSSASSTSNDGMSVNGGVASDASINGDADTSTNSA